MLIMTITNGAIQCQSARGRSVLTVRWPTARYQLPCVKYALEPRDLPPCDEFYDRCKAEGLDDETIIDEMIRVYVPFRLFSVGYLAKMSMIIGIIGRRGAGKSASAVYIAIFDYLIRNRPVFSDITIEVTVRYKDSEKVFKSRPWDGMGSIRNLEDSRGGLVLADEINLIVASSSLYASKANRDFNDDLQQLRKDELSMIWSAQKWSTVDSRTLWQTDFIIQAEDAWNSKKYRPICPGDKVLWEVFDSSGVTGTYDAEYERRHRYISDFPVWKGFHWIRPIWPAYDTKEAQEGNYHVRYRENQAATKTDTDIRLEARKSQHDHIIQQLLRYDQFYPDDLYTKLDEADIKYNKVELGAEIMKYFTKKRDSKPDETGKRRVYWSLKPEYRNTEVNS